MPSAPSRRPPASPPSRSSCSRSASAPTAPPSRSSTRCCSGRWPAQGEGIVGLFRPERAKPDSFRAFAYPNYVDVREQERRLRRPRGAYLLDGRLPAGDTTRRIFVELVSANYFDTLRVPLAAGRGFRPEEERPGANIPVVIVELREVARGRVRSELRRQHDEDQRRSTSRSSASRRRDSAGRWRSSPGAVAAARACSTSSSTTSSRTPGTAWPTRRQARSSSSAG